MKITNKKYSKINNNNNNNIIYLNNKNIFDIVDQRINAGNAGSTVIVPHVCNNANAYGAGFALDISRHYPTAKANFHLLGNQAKLGHSQFVLVKENRQYGHQIIVVNMIAQNGIKNINNPRPLNYAALVGCMSQIKVYASKFIKDTSTSNNIEIHAPKFGSGLAGGDWQFISDLINDIWTNIPTYIYSK